MIKRFTFSSISDDGEPVIFPVGDGLTKHASTVLPDLLAYLGELPDPAKNVVRTIITALSAFEGFGPNRNGDAWLEDHLLRENTYQKDGQEIKLPMYRSFESFARPYKHHQNRPNSPAYGNVMRSFYNPGMKRVELVVEWDRDKAPDICEKLEKCEPVKTSIGFRCMPHDVCSVCGNAAKNRTQYCSHLKDNMLGLMPDGRVACAINPRGMFFDISAVDDPADRTSHAVNVTRITIKAKPKGEEVAAPDTHDEPDYSVNDAPVKVASAKEHASYDGWMSRQFTAVADMAEKLAEFEPYDPGGKEEEIESEHPGWGSEKKPKADNTPYNPGGTKQKIKSAHPGWASKSADIIKRVAATVEMSPEDTEMARQAMKSIQGPAMSKKALRELARYPIKEALATAAALGIDLYPQEVQYIGLYGEHPKMADMLHGKNVVLLPDVAPDTPWEITEDQVNLTLAEKMGSVERLMEARSMWGPWKVRQMVKSAYFGDNPYLESTPLPAAEVMRVAPEGGISAAKKFALIAGLMLGAKVALGKWGAQMGLPGTNNDRALAIMGVTGLAGLMVGNSEGKELTRMPIMQGHAAAREAQGVPGLRQAMSAPLAYNMLFGPQKTAGFLTRALQASEDDMRYAATRLREAKPYLRSERRIKLGSLEAPEMMYFYEVPVLDAIVLNRAALNSDEGKNKQYT